MPEKRSSSHVPEIGATPLFSLAEASFEEAVARAGGRPAHARAIRRELLRRGLARLGEVDPRAVRLPSGLLARLAGDGMVAAGSRVRSQSEAGDGSRKLAVELVDGRTVECVVMPAEHGYASVCVSSQVGCPVACPFCASGIGGLVRDLEAHEIVEQFLHARARADVRRAVVMGIGEPLLNLDAVTRALCTVRDVLGLTESRLVISTVGFPDRVRALAASGRRFGLAISLHAVTDELRARLVPAMRAVPVREVIAAARDWAAATGGRVQFEWVVLRGVNDDPALVDELARRLAGMRAFVSFIAWNEVPGLPFSRPEDGAVAALVRRARDRGLVATRRRTLGAGATAACGQLRRDLARHLPRDAARPAAGVSSGPE